MVQLQVMGAGEKDEEKQEVPGSMYIYIQKRAKKINIPKERTQVGLLHRKGSFLRFLRRKSKDFLLFSNT